jgi:hypothetical protein
MKEKECQIELSLKTTQISFNQNDLITDIHFLKSLNLSFNKLEDKGLYNLMKSISNHKIKMD